MTNPTTPKEVTQAAMTEAGDLLPCQLADELERLLEAYRKPDSETSTAFALRSHMVAHADTILAVLRNTRAPITPSDRSQRAVVEARKMAEDYAELRDWNGAYHAMRVVDYALTAELAALQPPAADNATRTEDGLADLDMALDLICEAKGAEGPNGGFVTDHLDAAEGHLERVRTALRTTGQPAIAAAKPVGEADV